MEQDCSVRFTDTLTKQQGDTLSGAMAYEIRSSTLTTQLNTNLCFTEKREYFFFGPILMGGGGEGVLCHFYSPHVSILDSFVIRSSSVTVVQNGWVVSTVEENKQYKQYKIKNVLHLLETKLLSLSANVSAQKGRHTGHVHKYTRTQRYEGPFRIRPFKCSHTAETCSTLNICFVSFCPGSVNWYCIISGDDVRICVWFVKRTPRQRFGCVFWCWRLN